MAWLLAAFCHYFGQVPGRPLGVLRADLPDASLSTVSAWDSAALDCQGTALSLFFQSNLKSSSQSSPLTDTFLPPLPSLFS